MKDGSHEHSLGNRFGLHHHKRTFGIAVFALIFAFVAYASIQSPDIAFEIVVNNTNLGCGEGGTCERLTNQAPIQYYYTNDSAIQILLEAHRIINVSDSLYIILFVNDTEVQHQRLDPNASISYVSISTIIPKGSSYYVVNNSHHTEWREYPILSGKNGTLSINQTIVQGGGGGVSFNGSPVDLNGSSFYNGSQQSGTFNHSNLTNLDWFNSGHYNFTANETQITGLTNNLNNKSNLTRRTRYYVELTGSDSNDCLSVATACRTFQHVWNILANNSILYGDIDIIGGHGKFYETVIVPELFYDGFNVSMYGQMNNTNLGTADTGAAPVYGYSGALGYVQKNGAGWTTNQFQNKLLMNPSGQIATIASNNASQINYSLSSTFFTTFTAGQTITVMDWNTTIECNINGDAVNLPSACVSLSPSSRLLTYQMKIVNNATSGSNIGVFGNTNTYFNPKYSYVEGYGNTGAVLLSTLSYFQPQNSVFVGDGSVIRIEGGSRIFDRSSASNYFVKSTVNSFKTGIFIFGGNSGNFQEGFYIDGNTKVATGKGIWILDGSNALVLTGFISNFDSGIVAARNSVVFENSQTKYLNVNTNITPSQRIDNSTVL